MLSAVSSSARLLQRSAQAGRRFASTANQASSSTRARFALTTGACLAAAGGFAVFGGDVAQAKDKQSKSDMKYRHVIIGAGVAARSCLKTLSAHDKTDLPGGYDGKVLMIGNDARMNSVGYSDKDHEELEKPTNDPQVNLLLGHEASKLDISAKTVELNDGTVVKFDKCFIATGGHYPKLKSVNPNAMDSVTTFRRTEDIKALIDGAKSKGLKHIAVVGGGALGTDVALTLKQAIPDVKVTQIYAEPGALHRYLPEYMRAYVTALLRSKGIEQRNFSLVTDISKNKDGKLDISIDTWEPAVFQADHVVFAPTQIDANTDLAEDAGLEIDRENSGIIVNGELQAFSDIYVGGDAASFPNRFLGRRREQNYDHAVHSGEVAAKNMLGQRVLYDHIWLANVNLKPLGLRNVFVGDCDARYETFGFWEMSKQKKKGKTDDQYFFTSKYNKGATFYLDNGVIVGVLLCNIEDKDEIERARQVIRDRVDYSDLKRIEMEAELRELLGFEIQHPMTRSTMSKTAGHKKEARANAYKLKRTTTESVGRHSTDTIKDANTNLYWSAK